MGDMADWHLDQIIDQMCNWYDDEDDPEAYDEPPPRTMLEALGSFNEHKEAKGVTL